MYLIDCFHDGTCVKATLDERIPPFFHFGVPKSSIGSLICTQRAYLKGIPSIICLYIRHALKGTLHLEIIHFLCERFPMSIKFKTNFSQAPLISWRSTRERLQI